MKLRDWLVCIMLIFGGAAMAKEAGADGGRCRAVD
jgi:hypothetical protein